MKQGTIWLLTFGGLLCVLGVGLGIYMNAKSAGGNTFIAIGIIALVVSVALSLKDMIRAAKARQYEKDVLSGKIKKEVSKSYVSNRAKSSEEE